MYRSFVTCDDPKGVVQCKTIRKSKTGSQRSEGKVENCKMSKIFNPSSTNKEERKEIISKGITEELHNPSSFQIMEVSKGAEKLNRVIDSWSNGMKFDSRPKDVAKDLLKGALDLQESLVMLGKLQEASQYMAKLKKKSKGKSWDGKFDDVGSERMASNRFGNQNYQMGFQEQRLSVDGSSKDCYEELREVIRDSLSRQNLLPKTYTKEKGYCDGDFPSTSSSQSSMTQSHSFASSDCSPLSRAPHLKSSGPNLIAKLMGLEGAPSKQVESGKISSQRRPLFEFDMPKTRKPHFVVQKADPERRTLKEILETLQFKGLLRSNSFERFKSPSHHPGDFCYEKRSIDDAAPIVVIKPMRFSLQEAEENRVRMFSGEERALDTKEKLRKFKIKEEFRHKEVKDCKDILAKPEGKEIKTKEKLSSKIKASANINHKAEKEENQKKVEKTQKVKSNRRKPVEMENVKSKGTSGSHVHANVAAPKLHNSEKVSQITKNRITKEKSEASSPSSRRTTPTISHTSTDQKKKSKNGKAARKPVAANLAAEKIDCKDDSKGINTVVEKECDMARTNTASADQVFNEEEVVAPEIQVTEHCNDNQFSTSEVKQQTTQHESNTKSGEEEEANYCIDQDITENKFFKTKPNHKDVLLSSSSFLNRANELFDINSNQPILCVNDSKEADTILLLDCANELMELKSLQCRGTSHPFSHTRIRGSRICISLDLLAAEICNGIEKLRSYSKLSSERLSIDNLFGVLERDLWCKGMLSGGWDLGWRNGFSLDEVEQVVGDIEKLVLNSLLEDVLTGIFYNSVC